MDLHAGTPPTARHPERPHVVVVEPDPACRVDLERALAPGGILVVPVGDPTAARAAAARTSARLLVIGPGLDPEHVGGLVAWAGRDGRACSVVRVHSGGEPAAAGVHHHLSLRDAPVGLAAWAAALVSIVAPVARGVDRLVDAVAASRDALLVLDRSGPDVPDRELRISGVNEEAERLLGLSAPAALGMLLRDVPGLADAASVEDACARAVAEDRPHEVELPLGERWLACRAVPTHGGVAVSVRDVSERRRMDMRRESLWSLADAVAHGTDLPSLLVRVTDCVARTLRAPLVAVGEARDGDILVRAVNTGAPMAMAGPAVPAASALATAARTGLATRTRFPAGVVEGWHARSGADEAAVPVIVSGDVWGALMVATDTPGGVAGDAEGFLEQVAHLLAVAIGHAQARAELTTQATTDPLTGLANRRAFEERLNREFARARRHGRPLALALVDLDRFKRVNDRHGHAVGDDVLREVARRLRDCARATDVVARIGGEELAWLMPETEDLAAWQAVDRARRRVAGRPFPPAGTVTVSAGVCDAGRSRDAAELFTRADAALYWAKEQGRDVVFLYADDTATALTRAGQGARPVTAAELGTLRDSRHRPPAPMSATAAERVGVVAALLADAHGWTVPRSRELRDLVERCGLDGDDGPPAHQSEAAWMAHLPEAWDGSGPGGLAGISIPESARIVRVAREWERLLSPPPRGEGRDPGDARTRMATLRGRALCPRAVDHLLRLQADGTLIAPGMSPPAGPRTPANGPPWR